MQRYSFYRLNGKNPTIIFAIVAKKEIVLSNFKEVQEEWQLIKSDKFIQYISEKVFNMLKDYYARI